MTANTTAIPLAHVYKQWISPIGLKGMIHKILVKEIPITPIFQFISSFIPEDTTFCPRIGVPKEMCYLEQYPRFVSIVSYHRTYCFIGFATLSLITFLAYNKIKTLCKATQQQSNTDVSTRKTLLNQLKSNYESKELAYKQYSKWNYLRTSLAYLLSMYSILEFSVPLCVVGCVFILVYTINFKIQSSMAKADFEKSKTRYDVMVTLLALPNNPNKIPSQQAFIAKTKALSQQLTACQEEQEEILKQELKVHPTSTALVAPSTKPLPLPTKTGTETTWVAGTNPCDKFPKCVIVAPPSASTQSKTSKRLNDKIEEELESLISVSKQRANQLLVVGKLKYINIFWFQRYYMFLKLLILEVEESAAKIKGHLTKTKAYMQPQTGEMERAKIEIKRIKQLMREMTGNATDRILAEKRLLAGFRKDYEQSIQVTSNFTDELD